MPKTETRFSELRADGDSLTGVAVRYGDIATIGGQLERFEPGAFGNVAALDVILNVQHERTRPIARTGGGLTLQDGPESLRMAAALPTTQDAADALELVRSGVLRGLSVEFRAIRETFENGVRVIHEALLTGLGVVDKPAYPASVVEARAELRQEGETLVGVFPYNTPQTISDRGKIRKASWTPDSWAKGFAELNKTINDVLLQLGDAGRNQALGSYKSGSLRFENKSEALEFQADLDRDIAFVDDFVRQLESGQLQYSVRPIQQLPPPEINPKPYTDIEEKGNPGVFIRTYNDATLRSLNVIPRAGIGTIRKRWQPWL